MSTFKEVWTDLQQLGQPWPYLLIDCAGIQGGAAQLPRYIFSDIQCLFVGKLATALADVSPYLGQLKSLDDDVLRTVQNLMIKQAAILVVPESKLVNGYEPSFSLLYRHFRKCNMVQTADGEQLFFRYYDPRVLLKVVPIFIDFQRKELFGPVKSFIVCDSNKNLCLLTIK